MDNQTELTIRRKARNSLSGVAMEILLFIVAWFVVGCCIALLIGAAASLGDASLVKPVTRPAEVALDEVVEAKVTNRRRMRRKPAVIFPPLGAGFTANYAKEPRAANA